MHETRNFVLVIVLVLVAGWAGWSWLWGDGMVMRLAASAAAVAIAVWLVYALWFEDKLPDHLKAVIGDVYYDVDGLSFMPTVRVRKGRAELCVYYQNRYEGPVEVVVHLRPPEDSFVIQPGMRDVHFAFKASGGDFGALHQPISVPRHLQGDVIEVKLAAASFYPRSHGARLRKHEGVPCGTIQVDWGGAAFKTGVHEVAGEIKLLRPATLHLSMPNDVPETPDGDASWRQECIASPTAIV